MNTVVVKCFPGTAQAVCAAFDSMELNGIVTNVTNFGAFVDLGIHVNGLIHVSQMGGSRRNPVNPANILKIQQQVKVKVLSIDIDRERIGLALVK